jgi:signal transduction histidine kinase
LYFAERMRYFRIAVLTGGCPYAEQRSSEAGLTVEATDRLHWLPAAISARWRGDLKLAVLAGLAYFLTARLSLGLQTQPDEVAVFWPAAGISSGLLIALGRPARWPILVGVMTAIVAANLLGNRTIWAAGAFAVCDGVEALIVSSLVQRYFGPRFVLDHLRQVIGLALAAAAGTAIAGIPAAVAYALFHASEAPMLATWTHWFTSDCMGVISVAPLVIGLFAVAKDRPLRGELIDGIAVLAILAFTTLFVMALSRTAWEALEPWALLFPMLLWLAARHRPVFSAAGAFLVSFTIVCSTIFGIGHFGDPSISLHSRVVNSQALMLFLTLTALVLAALFAERRENESRLARSKMLLERERDNKFMGVEAVVAAISHELRQPLTGITTRVAAARRFLERSPPDIERVRGILEEVANSSFRSSEVLESFRALVKNTASEQAFIDMDELIVESLRALRRELDDSGVTIRTTLASDLPPVLGYKGLLRQVILNLVQNAMDAMTTVADRNRVLHIEARREDTDAIVVSIKDTGPGIDQARLANIFDAFVTTKAKGMGLGLAIARMIVEHHHGRLTASSDGRTGALFQFTLPIRSGTVTPA